MFLKSLPITLPSFVNKCGDIGMRLYPMLLVEHHISTSQASIIMGLVKGSIILASLAGGILGDMIGHKRTIALSFLLSGIGMAILPTLSSAWLICLAGMLTTFGQGLFGAPLRLLLVKSVPIEGRQEALAWLRSANNGAVMVANAVAYLTAGIGLAAMFIFDAVSSVVALVVGLKIMPGEASPSEDKAAEIPNPAKKIRKYGTKVPFILLTLLSTGFLLQNEIFFVASAAQAKLAFGDEGVAVFARIMMVNTLLCMLFAVYSTKIIKSPLVGFFFGFLFQGAGLLVFLYRKEQAIGYVVAILLQTLGELIFTAVNQFTLFKFIPDGKKSGRIYGTSLLVQFLGKAVGAALAFPVLTGGDAWYWGVAGLTGFFALMTLAMAKLGYFTD